MATSHDDQHSADDLAHHIVEADEDPQITNIHRNESEATAEAEFAEAEAEFARHEYDVSGDLIKEGKVEEGNTLMHEAAVRMRDASAIMTHAHEHEQEAERLRDDKRHELSRDLRKWDDQRLITLRDAVHSVRVHVEEMTDLDVRKIVRASDFSEDEVTRKREAIIEYGQTIEITLNEFNTVRRDPFALIKDLMTFTTFVYELAHYLPSLMEKLSEFGRILLQFRF